jgi:hypothetical protein
MGRFALYAGYLFGIDEVRPTRIRFARPFEKADSADFIDPMSGAITALDVGDDGLIIECGTRQFLMRGRSPYDFQLKEAV